jgi:hypothetical protein
MRPQEVAPPEALRTTIKCFWYTQQEFGEQPTSFEVVPDGYAEIIFYFGGPCSLAYQGGLQVLPSPFMVGLLNQPAIFHAQQRLEIIGIRCFPWTVFELLGLPAGQDGVRVMAHPIAQLQPALAACLEAGRVADALAHLATYFLAERAGLASNGLLTKAGGAMPTVPCP